MAAVPYLSVHALFHLFFLVDRSNDLQLSLLLVVGMSFSLSEYLNSLSIMGVLTVSGEHSPE